MKTLTITTKSILKNKYIISAFDKSKMETWQLQFSRSFYTIIFKIVLNRVVISNIV